MNKILLTDVDDTVLNFADHFQIWLHNEHEIISTKRLRHHFKVAHTFDIDVERSDSLIEQFSLSGEMANLNPENCAATILPQLYADGWRFVAITACVNHPDVVAARTSNLTKTFGFQWEAIHCVGMGQTKADILASYDPAIWVEDHFHNAVVGASLGHRTFLLDREYNRGSDHKDVSRVQDWHEIAKAIKA